MSQICSKWFNFLFSAYFGSHFCYHSNGKSQINDRLLYLGQCSNKLAREFGDKQLLIFGRLEGGGGGGQNSPLMHKALL